MTNPDLFNPNANSVETTLPGEVEVGRWWELEWYFLELLIEWTDENGEFPDFPRRMCNRGVTCLLVCPAAQTPRRSMLTGRCRGWGEHFWAPAPPQRQEVGACDSWSPSGCVLQALSDLPSADNLCADQLSGPSALSQGQRASVTTFHNPNSCPVS